MSGSQMNKHWARSVFYPAVQTALFSRGNRVFRDVIMVTREDNCPSVEEASKSATSARTSDTEENMQNSHMDDKDDKQKEHCIESEEEATVEEDTCLGSGNTASQESHMTVEEPHSKQHGTENHTAAGTPYSAHSETENHIAVGIPNSAHSETENHIAVGIPNSAHSDLESFKGSRDSRKDCECPQEEETLDQLCVVLDILPDCLKEEQQGLDSKPTDVCYVEMDADSDTEQEDVCRICHCGDETEQLISPCLCTGSVKYVHHTCLMSWLQRAVMAKCELCLYPLAVQRKRKPLNKWRLPDEKPIPLIWLMAFVIAMTLNVSSLANDGTQGCTSKPCIVFYVLGSAGALLGMAFFYHWSKKSATYLKKWIAWNEEWRLVGPKNLPATLGHPNLAFSTKSLSGNERNQAQVPDVKVEETISCSVELSTVSPDTETNQARVT